MKLNLPFKNVVHLPLKFIVLIVIVILIISSSSYVIFFTGKEKNDDDNNNGNNGNNNNGNNGENIDNEPPTIDWITGDTTGKKGEKVTISVMFSDNIDVTMATLYYMTAGDYDWSSRSILSGSVDISLTSKERLYYYVTVDDAAGNGPVGDPSTDGSSYYTITVLDDDENGDQDLIHYVLVEEGTRGPCGNCPDVADILDELYKSGEYNFYYVSMVEDENTEAHNRLYEDYNVYAFPIVFIDGGYEVIVGAQDKSLFEEKISVAASRTVPKLHVTVNAEFDNTTNELITNVFVKNYENKIYNGHLRVYLTEIISRWLDYNSMPYHYAFIGYLINEDISVDAGENASFQKIMNISDFEFSIDPENLMIVASVFSSEKHKGISWPPTDREFDAYYVDATAGVEVVEGGNRPPEVGIIIPEKNKRHLWGRPLIFKTLLSKTILIGKITITAFAEDDSGIEKVEFYIDGDLKETDTQEPYEYPLKRLSFPKHFRKFTITIKAYDITGKTSEASIDVISFRL